MSSGTRLVILVLIYLIGVVNGWIGGYQYHEHQTEIKEKNT
jgi:hypothetical protein